MNALSQERRLIQINTPLGSDTFIVASLNGNEGISKTFHFSLDLLSKEVNIDPKDLLGHNVSISLLSDNTSNIRFINGHISKLQAFEVNTEGLRNYYIEVVPSLWFTTLSSKNRIFHKSNVETIIKEVLGDYSKLIKFNFKAKGPFLEREYCVQYHETDFEFISRLLAEEGISYYFSHSDKKHELNFVNNVQDFFEAISTPLDFVGDSNQPNKDSISSWQRDFSYQTGGHSFVDYNEFTPEKNNKQTYKSELKLHNSDHLSIAEHGKFNFEIEGENKHKLNDSINKCLAQISQESHDGLYEIGRGISNANMLTAGGRFKLNHPTENESGEYIIISAAIQAADGNNTETVLRNKFNCVPAKTLVRPKHTDFKRSILTPQVATVVEVRATETQSSQDIYTQVRVKFPWNSEQNSCWVRVLQQFAGSNWGANFVPRVGQEVVINYIDGNPDRPIVTGAVYNGDNAGPNYTSTQSGWKTAIEGSKFNELRFDDKKDSEEIYMEAGKDHNWLVHNDQTGTVENNQTTTVEKNRTTTINQGNDQLTLKKGNQSIEISSGDYSLNVAKGTSSTDVMKAITITSKTSIELKVGANSIKIDQTGIEIKGTMVKAKASAMSELSSGGIMTVKGAITKIN